MRHTYVIHKMLNHGDLGMELCSKTPIVEVFGNERVFVENHSGVCSFDHCQITVRVLFGQVCILGSNLDLGQMSAEQLIITGKIDSVSFTVGSERKKC